MSSNENYQNPQSAAISGCYDLSDTIVAISTNSHGDGPIGIVRLSGPSAFSINEKLSNLSKDDLVHGYLKFSDLGFDEAMIVGFHQPKSYTGDDLIEFHCHGNRSILLELVNRLISFGARPASAGEFSYRAVMNGKMDLTQAESVQELIASQSAEFRSSAKKALSGDLKKSLESIRDKFLSCRSFIELDIDFMEQGYSGEGLKAAKPLIDEIKAEMTMLISQSEILQKRKSSIDVSLIGIPNAGKSELFNALLSENRSIVSSTKGTTRDTVSENVQIGSFLISLSDTAGLRDTEDDIEKEGVRRTLASIENSDLCVFIFDPENFSESIQSFEKIPMESRDRVIVALGKSDLFAENVNVENSEASYSKGQILSKIPTDKVIEISGKEKIGIKELTFEISNRLNSKLSSNPETSLLISDRQITLVKKALEEFQKFEQFLIDHDENQSSDLVTVHLNDAEIILEKVLGKITPDEMVNRIFSNFCIGK